MRRLRLTVAAAVLALAATMGVADAAPRTWSTHLTGAEEVPAVDTNAQGQIVLRVSPDGDSIRYRLLVANIDDVLMAHLHLAPAGTNGGVVVWLYPDAPPPQLIEGRVRGPLATGTITAEDLTGSLVGADLDALIDAIEAGNVYANVHTVDHGSGEVRGQLG